MVPNPQTKRGWKGRHGVILRSYVRSLKLDKLKLGGAFSIGVFKREHLQTNTCSYNHIYIYISLYIYIYCMYLYDPICIFYSYTCCIGSQCISVETTIKTQWFDGYHRTSIRPLSRDGFMIVPVMPSIYVVWGFQPWLPEDTKNHWKTREICGWQHIRGKTANGSCFWMLGAMTLSRWDGPL